MYVASQVIDLSKYATMQNLMNEFNILEVRYNKNRVNSQQMMSDFIYQSHHMECRLHFVLGSNPSANLRFSLKSISHVTKPDEIMGNVEEQFTIHLHWISYY